MVFGRAVASVPAGCSTLPLPTVTFSALPFPISGWNTRVLTRTHIMRWHFLILPERFECQDSPPKQSSPMAAKTQVEEAHTPPL
jgi:hypothetical protein